MNNLDLPISEIELPEGFEIPALDGPFDASEYIRSTPVDATLKGMFLQAFANYARQAGKTLSCRQRFYAFNDMPLTQALELAQETAERVHPELPLAQGLRQVGRILYPAFASSMIGKVIFSAATERLGTRIELAPQAIEACLSHGKLVVERPDDGSALLRLSDSTLFTECIPVGVVEGMLGAARRPGIVASRVHSLTEIEIFVRWQ